MKNRKYLKETDSTNAALYKLSRSATLPEGFVLYTDFQASGKGQSGNSWHSSPGQNLLFSLLLYPRHIDLYEHFILSQIVSIGIKKTLDCYAEGISIKWPNDIYWNNRKITGILIENSLQGPSIQQSVIGIGINVNEKEFPEDIPNPVSLWQITGKKYARLPILEEVAAQIKEIYQSWDVDMIRSQYQDMLFRKDGYHLFRDEQATFKARINDVKPDGLLELEKENGEIRGYYMKEVSFII